MTEARPQKFAENLLFSESEKTEIAPKVGQMKNVFFQSRMQLEVILHSLDTSSKNLSHKSTFATNKLCC